MPNSRCSRSRTGTAAFVVQGGVRHESLAAFQALVVDAVDDGRVDIVRAITRMRQQQAWAAGSEKALELGAAAVAAGAFDDEIGLVCPPVHRFGGGRMGDGDRLAVDQQAGIAGGDRGGEAAMGGVEAGEVGDAGEIGGLVDRDHLEFIRDAGLVQRAQVAAADPAVAVDDEAKRGAGNGTGGCAGAGCGHGGRERVRRDEALILSRRRAAPGAAALVRGERKKGRLAPP